MIKFKYSTPTTTILELRIGQLVRLADLRDGEYSINPRHSPNDYDPYIRWRIGDTLYARARGAGLTIEHPNWFTYKRASMRAILLVISEEEANTL